MDTKNEDHRQKEGKDRLSEWLKSCATKVCHSLVTKVCVIIVGGSSLIHQYQPYLHNTYLDGTLKQLSGFLGFAQHVVMLFTLTILSIVSMIALLLLHVAETATQVKSAIKRPAKKAKKDGASKS